MSIKLFGLVVLLVATIHCDIIMESGVDWIEQRTQRHSMYGKKDNG